MKRGQRKFVCADCGAAQTVHWTERLRAARLHCLSCGSLRLDVATAEGTAALRKGAPDSTPRKSDANAKLIADLVDLLSSATPMMRLRAVKALGSLGSAALVAVPAITERLRDEQPAVANAACAALKRIQQ